MSNRRDSDDERYRLPASAGARSPRSPPSRSYSQLREEDQEYSQQSPARARRNGRLPNVDICQRMLTPKRSPSVERTLSEHERHMDEIKRSVRAHIVDLELLRRLKESDGTSTPPPLPACCVEDPDFSSSADPDFSSSEVVIRRR